MNSKRGSVTRLAAHRRSTALQMMRYTIGRCSRARYSDAWVNRHSTQRVNATACHTQAPACAVSSADWWCHSATIAGATTHLASTRTWLNQAPLTHARSTRQDSELYVATRLVLHHHGHATLHYHIGGVSNVRLAVQRAARLELHGPKQRSKWSMEVGVQPQVRDGIRRDRLGVHLQPIPTILALLALH